MPLFGFYLSRQQAKRFGLWSLAALWTFLGLLGHDPWKPDEAYTFGLIYHILQGGDWVVPTLAGEPFLEKPPLFYWTAAVFSWLFDGFLPLHDGARLASGFYVALTLLFLNLTARTLSGDQQPQWSPVLLLLGCFGFLVRPHFLLSDLALIAGLALALYGLALSLRSGFKGGLAVGIGTGIGFMAKGLIAPGLVGLTVLILPMFKAWQRRSYFASWLWALLFALPWLLIWPVLLYQRSPVLFEQWFWLNNFGRFLGFAHLGPGSEPFYYVKTLLWFALPAWPLALWTLWVTRPQRLNQWQDPAIQLPVIVFLVMLTVFGLAADARDVYALPFLLPICLLAGKMIDKLPRGGSAALDWFGILTFGLLALVVWLLWVAYITGWPPGFFRYLQKSQPDFVAQFSALSLALALGLTLAWFVLIRPARQSSWRSILNWTGGITLVWGLIALLGLPFLNRSMSYRETMLSLKDALPSDLPCLASIDLGEPQRAMLHYYANILTRRQEVHPKATQDCAWVLVQSGKIEAEKVNQLSGLGYVWELAWEGYRPGDQKERLRLYRKVS